MTSVDEWLEAFITATNGDQLNNEDCEAILALASEAAHSSERTAAPLACWVASAAGLSPLAALEIARSIPSAREHEDKDTAE